MKTNTRNKIVQIIEEKGTVTPHQLQRQLEISPQMVHRHLKRLVKEAKLSKVGSPPQVFYKLKSAKQETDPKMNEQTQRIVNDHFWTISPSGEIWEGVAGFAHWCRSRQLPLTKTAEEYLRTLNKYHQFKHNGMIDGIQKIQDTFDRVWLDQLYYLDFYSIERFGKTKLGAMLLYAKQSQSLNLTKQLINLTKDKLESIAQEHQVNAVGFIPHTIPRKLQLQKEFEANLWQKLPRIKLVKVNNQIPVPQKTLSKLQDRIENAKNTIIVSETTHFDKILLFDDAVGSGSTLNIVAEKIKRKQLADQVFGVTITGSFKGFEVLREV